MGKNKDITPRKRAKVEILLKHSITVAEIAKEIGVSKRSVYRLKQKLASNKSFSPNRVGKCGRKRKTSTRDDSLLIRECKKNRKGTSKELQGIMEQSGIQISSSTVRRRLFQAGLRACRPLKKQKLTKQMKQKRLQWTNDLQTWSKEDWEQVKIITYNINICDTNFI